MVTLGNIGRPIKALKEAHKNTYSDPATVQRAVAEDVVKWIRSGEVSPERVSIQDAFEALVLEDNPHLDVRTSSIRDIREAMVSSSFPTITGELINNVFIREYDKATGNVLRLVTERESTHAVETYAGITPGENGAYTEEGAPYSEIQIGEKYITIPNFKFGKGVSMTREMVIFDLTGRLVERARRNGEFLGNQIARFICYRLTDTAWDEVDVGGTSNALVINGTRRAIYADDHSSWDTYTNDNLVSGAVPSISVVKGMRQLLAQMQDEKGEPIVATANAVYAHEYMADDLIQFFNAQEFDVNSAERNANIYRNSVDIVTSPFFPSTTNWFMGNPARQFILQWVWRPRTVADDLGDPQRDIVGSWWSSMMLGVGAEDYRFVVKNPY